MKTIFIILAIIAGLILIGFGILFLFLSKLSPLFIRKGYDIPLNEKPLPWSAPQTTVHEPEKDKPSLFEKVVEESRKQK